MYWEFSRILENYREISREGGKRNERWGSGTETGGEIAGVVGADNRMPKQWKEREGMVRGAGSIDPDLLSLGEAIC